MSALDIVAEYISSASHSQRLLENLDYAFRAADPASSQSLVRQLKQTIKQRRTPPTCKVRALQALDLALGTGNTHIRSQVARKILSRLMKIAKTRNSLRLFGEQSEGAEKQAAGEFQSLLLKCIKAWAEKFRQAQDGAAFGRVYHMLLRDKVVFPKEIKPQLELCVSAVEYMYRLLTQVLPDPGDIAHTVEVLNQQAKLLEQTIRLNRANTSDLQKYLDSFNMTRQALEAYQQWTQAKSLNQGSHSQDICIDISRIPRVLHQFPRISEPRSLPEPSNDLDSSQEIGFFFDFESDIHLDKEDKKLEFLWDEPDTAEIKEDWEAAKAQAAYLEEKVTEYEACLSSQERQISRKEEDIEAIQGRIIAMDSEKTDIKREIMTLETQLLASEKELAGCKETLKAKAQEDSRRANAFEERLQQAKTELAQTQMQLEALRKEKEELSTQTAAEGLLETELMRKEEELREVEEMWMQLQTDNKQLAELKEEIASREREIKAKTEAANEGRKLTSEIHQLQTDLLALEKELASIEGDLDTTRTQVQDQELSVQNTVRESQAAQTELHHYRTVTAKRAVEELASQLSISSHDARPARSETSETLNQSMSPLSPPVYPKVAPPDDDEDIEAEGEENREVVNWREYRKGWLLNQGLLYVSERLQVGFRRVGTGVSISICNVGEAEIRNLSFEFLDYPKGLEPSNPLSGTSQLLPPTAQSTHLFPFTCTHPFTQTPKLDIEYVLNSTKVTSLLQFPIGILQFCEPFQSQTETLEQQWTDFEPFQSHKTLSLYPFIRSFRDLAGILSGPGNLLVCSPEDANWLKTGELLATGKVLNREIMLQVTVTPLLQCELLLRAIPIRLRESVLCHLTCLLSPDL